MKKRNIILINIAIISVIIAITLTLPLSPSGEITERKPTFEWFGVQTGYTLFIDDNPDFTTPKVIQLNGKSYTPEENLELGKHYWKIKGLTESKTQEFTIKSQVSIKREEDKLLNDGNTRLKLGMNPTGAAILDIDEKIKIEENVKEVSARQDE